MKIERHMEKDYVGESLKLTLHKNFKASLRHVSFI